MNFQVCNTHAPSTHIGSLEYTYNRPGPGPALRSCCPRQLDKNIKYQTRPQTYQTILQNIKQDPNISNKTPKYQTRPQHSKQDPYISNKTHIYQTRPAYTKRTIMEFAWAENQSALAKELVMRPVVRAGSPTYIVFYPHGALAFCWRPLRLPKQGQLSQSRANTAMVGPN